MEADLLQSGEMATTHGPKEAGAALGRSAKRMMRLIHDLLDATRIEAGGLLLDRSQFAVTDAVADFAKSQEALVSSKGIALHEDVAPDVGDIVADRDRLLQVLEDPVGNAMKFTEHDGRITVRATPKRLFLFCSIVTARRKETDRGGTGLGLPIVKGIVEAHRGQVWVESRLGEGTSIFFTIPRGTAAESNGK